MNQDRLWTAHEVAERYGVSDESGRNYIRRIKGHMEKPLRVKESLLMQWEAERAVWTDGKKGADQPKKTRKRARKGKDDIVWIPGVSRIPMRKDA